MSMRGIAITLLAACSSGSSPQPTPPPPPPAVVAEAPPPPVELVQHCPPLSYNQVGWWAHEILPGCQAPPLEHGFALCAGKPCEQPCRSVSIRTGGNDVYKHVFVDGVWTQTATDPGEYGKIACTYRDGRRDSCEALGSTWTVTRDDKGRITSMVHGAKTSQIRYDDRGRAISINGDAIAYDHLGRMTKFGDMTLTWDDRRVIREEDPKRIATYHYDKLDRVVKIDIEDDRGTNAYELTYDGARFTSWSFGGSPGKRYEYCD